MMRDPFQCALSIGHLGRYGELICFRSAMTMTRAHGVLTASPPRKRAVVSAGARAVNSGGRDGNAGAIEASRQANAVAHGVSERMMVCVTGKEIYVFALRSPMGNDPEELLASFDRAGAEVEVKRFGLAKRLHITEGDQKMFLQGSTARVSPDAGGDKAVLEVLG